MLPFDRYRATEAAAYLMHLIGGKMENRKLVLFLYLADRKALIARGHPITTFYYVAREREPTLSDRIPVLFKIAGKIIRSIRVDEEFIWEDAHDRVRGTSRFKAHELSKREMTIIEEVVAELHNGAAPFSELLSLVRELPEVQEDGPIYYRDILRAAGKPEEDIAAIEGDIENRVAFDDILKCGSTNVEGTC